MSRVEEPYAATALPAAWLWTRYAGFRLSTVYLSNPPSAGLKKELGFREEARGANTWLVVPNDEGVFEGAQFVDGIRCVHPVQAYRLGCPLSLKTPNMGNPGIDGWYASK